MQPVVTAAQMRALDRATIEQIGIPAIVLMETAGRGVADAAARMLGGASATHVAVICGPGNNGGDGFVTARVLRARGFGAVAYLAVARDAIKGDARTQLEILERAGGVVRAIATAAGLAEVADAISGAALAIDALFGIGPVRPIAGHLANVVACFNRARLRLAVDVPSGLDADTGRADGPVVHAHRTVTMAARKIAHVSAPGFVHCGLVEVVDIGVPPALMVEANLGAFVIEDADVRGWLPRPSSMDHKGTRGHVLVIGGDVTMRGAGRLAAIAALRAGAGLVTLAGDGTVEAPDAVMTRSLDPDAPHPTDPAQEMPASALALQRVLERKAAIVIGPGLGTGERARARVDAILAAGIPSVLDADALNLLARDPTAFARAKGPVVITPHPAEAARLLSTTTAAVEADRLAAARALAARTGVVIVLKGARTIVCDGTLEDVTSAPNAAELRCWLNPTGGPALATGGTGDVLAGVIAALLAQGLAPLDAARAAVFVHGRAGEVLEAVHGRGAVSSDLPLAIAAIIRQLVP